jgi:hypothetical protein
MVKTCASNNDVFVKSQVQKIPPICGILCAWNGGQMALKLSQLQMTGYGQSNGIPSKNHSTNNRIKSRTTNRIKRINLLHSLIRHARFCGAESAQCQSE